jgi:rRNA maturation protein Rpf1
VNYKDKSIELQAKSLCFTYCQIPIIYKISNQKSIEIIYNNTTSLKFDVLIMDNKTSKQVFKRTNEINQIVVHVLENELK